MPNEGDIKIEMLLPCLFMSIQMPGVVNTGYDISFCVSRYGISFNAGDDIQSKKKKKKKKKRKQYPNEGLYNLRRTITKIF